VVDDELVKPTPTYPTIRLESSLPPHTKKKKKKKKVLYKICFFSGYHVNDQTDCHANYPTLRK
jgi:hypothetical protein